MSFDSHSLERLEELGRRLPKEISKPLSTRSKNTNESTKQKLHPVEVENNPEQLFRELMEISPDGNIPIHLLDRLKELEKNSIEPFSDLDIDKNENPKQVSNLENVSLYTQFKQLLLEDETN